MSTASTYRATNTPPPLKIGLKTFLWNINTLGKCNSNFVEYNYNGGTLVVISDVLLTEAHSPPPQPIHPTSLYKWNIPGRWIAITVPNNDERSSVQWTADAIGAKWIYFLGIEGNVIFSDDYSLLIKAQGPLTKIDSFTATCAITLGYCLGDSTVRPGILLGPGGCTYEWEGDGFRIIKRHAIDFGDALAHLRPADRESMVMDSLSSAAEDWAKFLPEDTAVSLSAGYDCRTALAYLMEQGVKPKLFTFGQKASTEVRDARAVAAAIGARTEIFDVASFSWEAWRHTIRTLGTTGPVQSCGWSDRWLATLAASAKAVIHGYLGDALTGKHLPKTAESLVDPVRSWVDWSYDRDWGQWRGLTDYGRKYMIERLVDEFGALISNVSFAFPHQKIMYLDLYTRQRSWVASQANEMSIHVTPACFFYHSKLWSLWANLPEEDLRNQRIYLKTAKMRFPLLFGVSTARQPNTLNKLVSKLSNIQKQLTLGERNPAKTMVIDRKRLLSTTKRESIEQIEKCKDQLDSIIDVKYIRDKLQHIDDERLTPWEYASLIRVINVTHLLVD